jgi:hypothetical protein
MDAEKRLAEWRRNKSDLDRIIEDCCDTDSMCVARQWCLREIRNYRRAVKNRKKNKDHSIWQHVHVAIPNTDSIASVTG